MIMNLCIANKQSLFVSGKSYTKNVNFLNFDCSNQTTHLEVLKVFR